MRIAFSGAQALATAKANPERGWTHSTPGRSAKERFNSGKRLDIAHRPKFTLDPSWPIFTMGSCFAREIEDVLIRDGLPVLTAGHGVEAQHLASWNSETKLGANVEAHDLHRGALNKYTVRSMLHEVRTAFGLERFPHEGLLELKDGLWFDPHSAGLRKLDYETALVNRRRIAASSQEMRKARAVFLTLGLTETWFDSETGLSMNVHPGADWLARLKHRFHFVDYGFGETCEQMRELIALIREHCHPDMRFILTVSPVPLHYTFKDLDIVVAHSGSKALLRTVAEEIARADANVDYFPSYEFVAFSPRREAYLDDLLHVHPDVVSDITRCFIASYYPSRPAQEPSGPGTRADPT